FGIDDGFLLAREAGIAKPPLLEGFGGAADAPLALCFPGRCFEGNWVPPFSPWVEAIEGYLDVTAPEQLQLDLGHAAAVLAQLSPAIRFRLPDAAPAAPLSQREERLRLYDAVAQFLLAAARRRPLVLLLDDLHWADRSSLELLQYCARTVRRSRLLIVGAYRDLEVEPDHTLNAALATLQRDLNYRHILLSGLSAAEIAEYVRRSIKPAPHPELAQAIWRETNGNPLFVGELVRQLSLAGAPERTMEATRLPGRVASSTGIAPRAERSDTSAVVLQLIRSRLARLSPDARRLLTFASGFTAGFDFRLLPPLAGLPENRALDCLDEVLQARILHSETGSDDRYDFVLAIVRRALYDALSPSRRLRLHRRIAETMESVYAEQLGPHAAELAAHYSASRELPGADRGLVYALMAAEQARSGATP
ncbi:MAG: ATP-binding protein, partial [Dehalococcoidia bacterium]